MTGEDMEEERRLCYVGITRAEQETDHDQRYAADGAGRDTVQ